MELGAGAPPLTIMFCRECSLSVGSDGSIFFLLSIQHFPVIFFPRT